MVVDLAKSVALYSNDFRKIAEQPFLETRDSHRGAERREEVCTLLFTPSRGSVVAKPVFPRGESAAEVS